MEQELISKKELLQRYEISYGALYRWKRMGLIPEEWFIKKSTSTGQETFFPKELICERMELIQSQKEEIPLDELSKQIHEEKMPMIMIETLVEEKRIPIEQIQNVYFDNGDGKKQPITEAFMKLLRQEE